MSRRRGGFTYLETLAATALIGLVVLSSTGLLLRWHDVSERLEHRAAAEHALAVEMDEVLARAGRGLRPGPGAWLSEAAAASGLPEARGELLVEPFGDTRLRRVMVSLSWSGGEAVRETLLEPGR